MAPPYICQDGNSFQLRMIAFQSSMSPGKGLHPDGRKTMGNVTNATTRFARDCESAFAGIDQSTTALELVGRAVRICNDIVGPHVFQDGNGRTSMYAIYLFLACWGYQLKIPPTALHAYLYGESQRDSLPFDMRDRIAAFTVPLAPEAKCWSLVLRMERKLKALETTRSNAVKRMKNPHRHSAANVSNADGAKKFVLAGKSAIDHVRSVQEFPDIRVREREEAKRRIAERSQQIKEIMNIYCNQHSNPFTKQQMGNLIAELGRKLGRQATPEDIKDYLDDQ